MNRPKSDVEKLNSLLDALEESILQTPDEEITEEARREGKDPEAVANNVHNLITSKIKESRQKKLGAAREGYERFSDQTKRSIPIPDSPSERRLLLTNILNRRSDVPQEITIGWREGRYTSDADVASILEDLAELGFLEEES